MHEKHYYLLFNLILIVGLAMGVKCGATDERSESFELFPRNIQYGFYMASPLQPRFKLSRLKVVDAQIPETGDSRWELKAGRSIVCFD